MSPSLSFGFGYTPSLAEQATSYASEAANSPLRYQADGSAHAASAASRSVSKRRRSSSASDIATDDVGMESAEDVPKRKRGALHMLDDTASPSTSASATTSSAKLPSRDLGRILAAYEKPVILSLVLDLAKEDERLAERIYTRLPTPSVDHAMATLQTLEARVRAAIPTSASAVAQVRDQYIWSRVRTVLAELVSELACLIPLFSMTPRSETSEAVHPSTAFTFLHAATSCALRVVRMLPADTVSLFKHVNGGTLLRSFQQSLTPVPDAREPFASTIFPMLLREWQAWLHAIDAAVNQHARIFGQDAILAWERGLASLGTGAVASRGANEHAMRAMMDDTAAQMHTCIGWLVQPAHRTSWLVTPSGCSSAMDEGDE